MGLTDPAARGEHSERVKRELLRRNRETVGSPLCESCGGGSHRSVRTRKTAIGAETILYLAEVWTCSVCGHQWEDEMLECLNGRAAEAARGEWASCTGHVVATTAPRRGTQPSFPKAHFCGLTF